MASKKQISEQAMRILSGGHLKVDRTLDIREVMLALDQIRDEAMRLSVYNNVKNGEYSVDHAFLSQYTLTTSTDSATGYLISTLPVKIANLPYNLGLYEVAKHDDPLETFAIAHAGHNGLLGKNLATARNFGALCYQIGDSLYFVNHPTEFTSAIVTVAASSKSITELADYPIPPDIEHAALARLVEIFSMHQQSPHDELEDGNK